jgi:hypothetical protein
MLKALTCLALVSSVVAVPKWHDINDFDLQGNKCPGPNNFPITCSPLCVKNLNLCPPGFASCPKPGDQLCEDGTCGSAADCEEAGSNPCMCPNGIARPEDDKYVSCRIAETEMDDFNESKVAGYCAEVYNVTEDLGELTSELSDGAEGPLNLSCESSPSVGLSGIEDGFIAVYIPWGAFIVLNLIWWAGFKNSEKDNTKDNKNQKLTRDGYNNHVLGSLIFGLLVCLSLLWQGLFVLITLDYYGLAIVDEFAGVFGNYNNLYSGLIIVWHLSVIWYASLIALSDLTRNWFRVKTSFATCEMVQVWQQEDPIIFLADDSWLMTKLREFDAWKVSVFGVRGNYSTLPVKVSSKVSFVCVRVSSKIFE